MNSLQKKFNPIDYGFRWTEAWYEFDGKVAEKKAMKDRNTEARRLRAEGWTVRKSSTLSLLSQGGIGSGRPHIELWTKVYRLDAYRARA